jgi:heme a synthase
VPDVTRLTLQRLSIGSLAFTLAVIVWGAFVRVSGSGAGCGSHWPTCNGEVLPRANSTATVIEFTHRITSSVALLLVVVVLVGTYRALPKGHAGRAMAWASLFFMLTEAAVGAGLVLFEYVAGDTRLARGYWMAAHLVNTFLLVAFMTLTAFFARHDPKEGGLFTRLAESKVSGALIVLSTVGFLVTGVTGAIAALGDTLFPANTFLEGAALDLDPQAHLFLRLRALHPLAAVLTTMVLLYFSSVVLRLETSRSARRAARLLGTAVVAQIGVGVVNLLLAAPAALQLLHLLVADLAWMAFVWTLGGLTLERSHASSEGSREGQPLTV